MKRQSMLRGLLLLVAAASLQGAVAQEKLFQAALEQGRQPTEFYVARNEKGKAISLDKMRQYAEQHNYLIGEVTTRTIDKFGDKAIAVSSFEFLPATLYPEYIYALAKDLHTPQYKQLSQLPKGSCYVFSGEKFIRMDNVSWTGKVVGGMLSGLGYGVVTKLADSNSGVYYFFECAFQNGLPQGECELREVVFNAKSDKPRKIGATNRFKVKVDNLQDGLATFTIGDKSEIGFVQSDGVITLSPTYSPSVVLGNFKNGRIAIKNEKGEGIYVDKNGKYIDYTEAQKKIFADAKAREDSIKAAEQQAKLLAEKKAAEEKRIAEEKEADLKRRIEINKNVKLWTKGCRLAYRYPNGREYVIATLEEWNENRSKVKVKIVASPSSTRTLNGDLLEKNNTMWVSAHNEGWHLALDDEITIALNNDNSTKKAEVIVSSSSSRSSGPTYTTCSSCRGTGYVQCYSCYGKGSVQRDSWDEDEGYKTCSACGGRGRRTCSSCDGTGRR